LLSLPDRSKPLNRADFAIQELESLSGMIAMKTWCCLGIKDLQGLSPHLKALMFSTGQSRIDGIPWARLIKEAVDKGMPPYKTKLSAQKTLCAGTTAFYFEKPEDFEFQAGQFVNFTLLNPGDTDLQGNTRTLSIASAPHERKLMVAMRLRTTAFKRSLDSLPLGTELLLQGPYGWMTLPRNTARPAVLLAGGIGITPFRSLIWSEGEALSPRKILLVYSVRVPEEAAFLEELHDMEQYNKRYKLICTVTQPEKSTTHWEGEIGRISIEMLSKWIPDLTLPIYYIAGPPGMVTSVRQMLIGAGIAEEDIRAEEFCGYE
jgi:ferredoxin-NADP reductase